MAKRTATCRTRPGSPSATSRTTPWGTERDRAQAAQEEPFEPALARRREIEVVTRPVAGDLGVATRHVAVDVDAVGTDGLAGVVGERVRRRGTPPGRTSCRGTPWSTTARRPATSSASSATYRTVTKELRPAGREPWVRPRCAAAPPGGSADGARRRARRGPRRWPSAGMEPGHQCRGVRVPGRPRSGSRSLTGGRRRSRPGIAGDGFLRWRRRNAAGGRRRAGRRRGRAACQSQYPVPTRCVTVHGLILTSTLRTFREYRPAMALLPALQEAFEGLVKMADQPPGLSPAEALACWMHEKIDENFTALNVDRPPVASEVDHRIPVAHGEVTARCPGKGNSHGSDAVGKVDPGRRIGHAGSPPASWVGNLPFQFRCHAVSGSHHELQGLLPRWAQRRPSGFRIS